MTQRNEHPVMWWVGWIVLTIVAFFIPCWFWTGFIAEHMGPMDQAGMPVVWVAAVFGTWMLFLVPLIIVMYNKVDRAYEDARVRRESQTRKTLSSKFSIRTCGVDEKKRLLPKELRKKLKRLPKTLKQGQLVRLRFRDGRELPNVFVWGSEEVVGVYGRTDFPFDAGDAVSAELMDPGENQPVEYEKWLRLENVKNAGG